MRRAAKRDLSEGPIVIALRALGWSVQHLNIADGPDLVLGRNGQTLLAEVKTGKAKVKRGQADWHARWRGAPVVILRNVDDAIQLGQFNRHTTGE